MKHRRSKSRRSQAAGKSLSYNLGNFLWQAVLPRAVRHWTLTTLREKLIKIGAIWTALPPRFKDAIGIPFTPGAALEYLNGLTGSTKDSALQYIHDAPPQTMTAFRRLLLAKEIELNSNQR